MADTGYDPEFDARLKRIRERIAAPGPPWTAPAVMQDSPAAERMIIAYNAGRLPGCDVKMLLDQIRRLALEEAADTCRDVVARYQALTSLADFQTEHLTGREAERQIRALASTASAPAPDPYLHTTINGVKVKVLLDGETK